MKKSETFEKRHETSAPTGGDTSRCIRADARRNDELLITAAHEAFLERGTDASLEDIARNAGVGIGTLYRHFPTRQDLVEAVMEQGLHSVTETGRGLLDAPAAGEALFTFLRELVVHATTFRGLAKSMTVAFCKSDNGISRCEEMRLIGASLLQRCQQSGDIRADVTVDDVVIMVNALAWTAEQSSPARLDTLLSIMLDGLKTPS